MSSLSIRCLLNVSPVPHRLFVCACFMADFGMFIETASVFAPFLPSCRGVDRFFLFELLPKDCSTSSDPVRIRTAMATLPVSMLMSSRVSWLSTAYRGVRKGKRRKIAKKRKKAKGIGRKYRFIP